MNKVSRKILPKILIGVPTYDGKNYCLPQFLENISKFTYPKERLAIYVADNSIDNKNALMINKKYGIKTFWKDYTGYSVYEKLADSHNQLRRYALDGNFDYLFHLESDVFPQPDILEQLLWARKPVVCGLYQVYDAAWRSPCLCLTDKKHEYHESFVFHAHSQTFYHWFIDGKVKPCYIAGIGNALIKRKVLKHFKFRQSDSNYFPPDTWFAEDLRTAGVQNYIHTGVLAFHWNKEDWGRHTELIDYHKSE